jgi:hypothetical protein
VEPPLPDRLRHPDDRSRLDRQQPFGDLDPERSLDLALERRMTGRPQLRADRPIRYLPVDEPSNTSVIKRCCDDRLNAPSVSASVCTETLRPRVGR